MLAINTARRLFQFTDWFCRSSARFIIPRNRAEAAKGQPARSSAAFDT
jgi:hypothetical protein